jgi:hypothetical protein
MKNTIKMSLVAALAVSALSTSASAGSLEDAIKGVSIKGKMEVEYDYTDVDGATSDSWDYDWDVTAKVPLSDQWTAIAGFQADDKENISTAGNSDASVTQTKYYFQYANGPVTAMVGKMGMAGAPWYDDERASGAAVIVNAGPVAVAAAHFTNDNGLTKTEDISAAAIIAGNIADSGINASLWYADIANVGSSYSLDVNGKVADMVNFDFRHTDVDLDATDAGNSLTKVVVSADVEAVNVRLGYGMTDEDGGLASFESSDTDAATTFGLEQLNIEGLADADVFLIGAGTNVAGFAVNLDYIDGEAGSADFNELLLDVEYKFTKSLTLDTFYSTAEFDGVDMDAMSVALEYKF